MSSSQCGQERNQTAQPAKIISATMTQDVVFDLGGVLLNWQPPRLLQSLLPELSLDQSAAKTLGGEIFQSFNPASDWARFDLGLIQPDELAQRIASRTVLSVAQVRRVIDGIPDHLHALTDTVNILQSLAQSGHRLFFLSNMPAPYADILTARERFFRHFSDGIFSAHVQCMKPDAALFKQAQARFQLETAPVFVDDMPVNVEAATRHGWRGLRFENAPALSQALQGMGLLPAISS
jgi:HAD superfamily hydrolase (TIGR01509 family)